jgi:hypothetical protein
MIRKLLISEQERQSILKSHGLLSEIAGDQYLLSQNYSVQKVLGLTMAVNAAGHNDIIEFKKKCIKINAIGLSKREIKNLQPKINNQWDALAEKCMNTPRVINNSGKLQSTPNKVYTEYQKILEKQKLDKEKNEELKNIIPTLNPTLKNLAQDYIGYKDRKYCPNFNIEYTKNQTFRCDINNKNFGIFHQYDEGGNLQTSPSSTARLYNILQPNVTLTQESGKKINEFINSQSGGLVQLKHFTNTNGEINLNFLNVKNYDDVKKLYQILENLSSKSEEIKSLAAYDNATIDNTKNWMNFLNETDNKKYCSNPAITEFLKEKILNCSFDIAKTNEPGKFYINWQINKNKIIIDDLIYTLTEKEKNDGVKQNFANNFKRLIPKGFESMVTFFDPFYINNDRDLNKLDFSGTGKDILTFDDIKILYEYVIQMEKYIKK